MFTGISLWLPLPCSAQGLFLLCESYSLHPSCTFAYKKKGFFYNKSSEAPPEVVDAPFLQTFRVRLDGARSPT